MRFHFIANFTRTALAQRPRRRLSTLHDQQRRAYTPSGPHRHHQLTGKTRASENPSHFSSNFAVFRRYYSSTSSNSSMGILSWYLGLLESRPILTKSMSSAVIYGAADITSQVILFFDCCNAYSCLYTVVSLC